MKKLSLVLSFVSLLSCSTTQSFLNKKAHLYTINNALIKSHKHGKLSDENFRFLKKHLTNISNNSLNFNTKTVINYIDNDPKDINNDYQTSWDIFDGCLTSKLNSMFPCNHLWVINERVKNLNYYHNNKINWTTDQNNIIRQLFFNNTDGFNGGFVIIKPNGEYFLKIGEYKKEELLDTFKEFN